VMSRGTRRQSSGCGGQKGILGRQSAAIEPHCDVSRKHPTLKWGQV
jgi:hypothetical protein